MKKAPKKLALSRETLSKLSAATGGDVFPSLNTIDLLPQTELCRTRFCGTLIETVYCPLVTIGCPLTTF